MALSQRIHWSGLVAMVGGVLCGVYGALLASRPPGIVGGPHRAGDDLELWIITGLVLIVVGVIGLDFQHAGRTGRLGRAAVLLAIVGVVLVLIGGIVGWIAFISGYLTFIVSLLLFGVAFLRAGVLPRWASVLLLLTPLC